MTIDSGSCSSSWRHSSEPIEPPAPVTSTRLPVTSFLISDKSRLTGSRPNRSVISILRIWEMCGFCVDRSNMEDTVLHLMLQDWHFSTMRLRFSHAIPLMAINTS